MDAVLLLNPYQMPSIVNFLVHPNSSTFAILAESSNYALRHSYHITFIEPALINRYSLNFWRATTLKRIMFPFHILKIYSLKIIVIILIFSPILIDALCT